jgi:uncharacterized RDD family membrane protein YckC
MKNQEQETVYHSISTPSFLVRIKSMFIDVLVTVLLMYIATLVLETLKADSNNTHSLAFVLVFLYEPICTTLNRTLGQAIMGIRVRNYNALSENGIYKNINFPFSLFRFIVKTLLGWVSFVTIHSDPDSRAIHDKMANSVMVYA